MNPIYCYIIQGHARPMRERRVRLPCVTVIAAQNEITKRSRERPVSARRAVDFQRTKRADRSLDPSRDFFSRAGDGERKERGFRATHIDLHSAYVLAASTCCGQLVVIIRRS